MKPGIRTGAAVTAAIMLAVLALAYLSSDRMGMAGKAAAEAREATFQNYRTAQALKSLIHGYELTINEYYSTVLEFPVYKEKADGFKTAIAGEMATLKKLNTGDATAIADLDAAFGEIETLRLELESALSGADKDWDLAREALYKLNVVSIRAIQPADRIARIAGEHAVNMDTVWQNHQTRALQSMQIIMLLVLAAGALAVVGVLRGGQAPTREA